MSELPPRRMNRTGIFVWEQLRLIVTAGFDGDRVAREVFARPHRTDRALDSTLDDIAMMISHHLQEGGLTAAALRARLSPAPLPGSPAAPSLVGCLLDAVIELQAELAEEWRRALEAAGLWRGSRYGGNVHEISRAGDVTRDRREHRDAPDPSATPPPL